MKAVVKSFVERQLEELIENGPVIVQATTGLLVGSAAILVLAFGFGFLHYVVGMWVTAVVGLVCLVRPGLRPFGKGLIAAASTTLSLLPVMLFGALFSSLG